MLYDLKKSNCLAYVEMEAVHCIDFPFTIEDNYCLKAPISTAHELEISFWTHHPKTLTFYSTLSSCNPLESVENVGSFSMDNLMYILSDEIDRALVKLETVYVTMIPGGYQGPISY